MTKKRKSSNRNSYINKLVPLFFVILVFVLIIALLIYIFRSDVSINLNALFSSVPIQIYFLIIGIVIILVLAIIAHYSLRSITSFMKVFSNMRKKIVQSQILELKKEKELKHLLERKRDLKHKLSIKKRDFFFKNILHFLGFFKTEQEIRRKATAERRKHEEELKDVATKLKLLKKERKLKEAQREQRMDSFKSIFRMFGLFKTPEELRKEVAEERKKEKARLEKLADKEKYLKEKRKIILSNKKQRKKEIKDYFKSLFSIFGVYKKIYNSIKKPYVVWRKKRKLKQRWKEKKQAKEAKKHTTAYRVVPLFFVLLALILTLVGVLFVSDIGLTSSSDVAPTDLDIDQIMIKILLNEGETLESEFRVMNIGNGVTNVNLNYDFYDMLSLSDTEFELNPGETKVVTIKFNSVVGDIEYAPGIYIGNIDVESEGGVSVLPIIVEVESTEVLFDMNIIFPTVDIIPGSDVNPTVRLYNLMGEDALSLDIEYFVKDIDGNSLYTESETVVVDSQVSFTKNIDFPENFRTGTYVFGAIASYAGSSGTSSYVFDVVEASSGIQSSLTFCSWTNPTCWLVGLIIIMLVLFVLTYFIFFIQAYLKVIIKRREPQKEVKKKEKKKSLSSRVKSFRKNCREVNDFLLDHFMKGWGPISKWYVGWKKRRAKARFERKKELLERKKLKELKLAEEKEQVLKQKMLDERAKRKEERLKKKAEILEEKKIKKEKAEKERQEKLERLKEERLAIREEKKRRKEEKKKRKAEERERKKEEKERLKRKKQEFREEKEKEKEKEREQREEELREKKEKERKQREEELREKKEKERKQREEELREKKEEKEKERKQREEELREKKEEKEKEREQREEELREKKEEKEKERKQKREEKEEEERKIEEKKEKVRLDMEAAKKREEEEEKRRFEALKRKERRKKAIKRLGKDVKNTIIGAYVGVGKKYSEMQKERERKRKEAEANKRKEEEERRRLIIEKQRQEDERRLQNMIVEQKERLEDLENQFEDEKRRDIERLTTLKLKMDTEKRKFVNQIQLERQSMMGGSKRSVFRNLKKNFENYNNKKKFRQKQSDIKKKFALRQEALKSRISKEDSEINEIKKKLKLFKK